MPLQDLTPQLRTRLNRIEKLVGVFVTLASFLLLAGLCYYMYNMAQRKGWFLAKVHYQTSLKDAGGLTIGDPVKLMGFNVGEITSIEANEPGAWYSVTIGFTIKAPYYGYLWTDSKVKVASVGVLGGRGLEVIKGVDGAPTVEEDKTGKKGGKPKRLVDWKKIRDLRKSLVKSMTNQPSSAVEWKIKDTINASPSEYYVAIDKSTYYWMVPDESPDLSERLGSVISMAESALPNILDLTNKINRILTNTAEATEHVNDLLVGAKPVVTNVNMAMQNVNNVMTNVIVITGNLRNPNGSLGDWLLPPAVPPQMSLLFTNLNLTMTNVNTNFVLVISNVNESLENVAGITSNLNMQVQANSNILSQISSIIVDTDDMIQGLKRHWLFRSAFKQKPANTKTNAPAATTPDKPSTPARSPKDSGR